jgi:flagellar hook-associated protein 2
VSTSSTTASTSAVNVPFTGLSQYASDFQAILNKAAQVAQIPITLLQSQDATALGKETALGSLQTSVASLATSVQNLGQLAANQALTATSSDSTVVTATADGATNAGSYTIDSVTSIATAAAERTTAFVADSSNSPLGSMTLVIGGVSQTFQVAANNLNGLVNQINALNAGVTASVVSNNGSNYLSLASASGPQTVALYDGPDSSGTDMLTTTGSGIETTTAGFANAAGTQVSKPSFTLQFGLTPYTFQLNNNNDSMVGLRDAMNASGAGVTASILTTSGGNYLSLQANSTGANALQLYAGATAAGTDLLTGANQGSDAVFQLNGINVDQKGNVAGNIVPGLTFTLQGKSATPVTITLASDPTQLSSALQDLVTKYNALSTAVAAQTGQAGGSLTGDTVINQIRQTLQQIAGYTTSSGTVQSLADLGVQFGDLTGQASFNQTTFDSLSQTQIADAFKYVGSTTTGLGGLSQQLTEYSDPISGLIQSEVSGLKTADQDLQTRIATLTARASTVQAALIKQMEAADAAQAELQSQQQQLTASLQGLSLVLYGQNPNTLG